MCVCACVCVCVCAHVCVVSACLGMAFIDVMCVETLHVRGKCVKLHAVECQCLELGSK